MSQNWERHLIPNLRSHDFSRVMVNGDSNSDMLNIGWKDNDKTFKSGIDHPSVLLLSCLRGQTRPIVCDDKMISSFQENGWQQGCDRSGCYSCKKQKKTNKNNPNCLQGGWIKIPFIKNIQNNSFFIHDKSMMNNRLLPAVQMCPLVVNDESVKLFQNFKKWFTTNMSSPDFLLKTFLFHIQNETEKFLPSDAHCLNDSRRFVLVNLTEHLRGSSRSVMVLLAWSLNFVSSWRKIKKNLSWCSHCGIFFHFGI